MYLKLVLASFGLICVGVASGSTSTTCYTCFGIEDESSQELLNCRRMINITATDRCSGSPRAYCIFYYGNTIRNQPVVTRAVRKCSLYDCQYYREWSAANLHCSHCEESYCNIFQM
ncbi:hypothetical protein PPYR_00637 [Photinus pyralis]|uniref:Protein quiver n=1 Tax=Photinus pyralis TaxID=7054 RepID=A0A5N4B246_PHOPY|nr:uncharacterized protein LOC116160643 [Photinus pyralis]KAB0803667.1 hypothetical protein PPYR_00637 [Photinus pyralis]